MKKEKKKEKKKKEDVFEKNDVFFHCLTGTRQIFGKLFSIVGLQ
jgi:hypothetical protein